MIQKDYVNYTIQLFYPLLSHFILFYSIYFIYIIYFIIAFCTMYLIVLKVVIYVYAEYIFFIIFLVLFRLKNYYNQYHVFKCPICQQYWPYTPVMQDLPSRQNLIFSITFVHAMKYCNIIMFYLVYAFLYFMYFFSIND